MATLKLETGTGLNNYSSNVVGYESKRHRREMYSFTIPNIHGGLPVLRPKIVSCEVNFDEITTEGNFYHQAGSEIAIYYSVGEGDFDSSIKLGGVTIAQASTAFGAPTPVELTPGKTYTLYVHAEENTYGWYWFGTSSTTLTLGIEYESYTNCTAPDASSIEISPSIQKPGGEITIKWGEGEGGTSNSITGYKVQYKIGSGDWSSAYSTTTASKTITLPTDAARGQTITAQVMSVGTISGYDSPYSGEGGSGRVNNLPEKPTVTEDKDLVPWGGGNVTFTLVAGGVGTGDIGQSASLYYAPSLAGTKTPCVAEFIEEVKASTTYYFWTYDGLEYSDPQASREIKVNSKPTVTLEIENGIATFTNGDNGQPGNNTYTFGFTYNNQDYILSSSKSETTYTIGDMRKQLSDELGSLTDNTTYFYNFWVQRNDGIEESDKDDELAESAEYSLSIPKFTLVNDKGNATFFSKKVTVTLSGDSDGSYNTVALGEGETSTDITSNTATLDTDKDKLGYGKTIEKLWVNDSFYVTLQTTLTKVYAIDIIASGGMASPYTPNPFFTYTSQTLDISLAGRLGAEYGLDGVPNLTVTSSKGTIEDIQGSSGNDNTWTYSISGTDLYELISSGASTLSLVFSIKNKFKDVFRETFSLDLINTAAAVTYFEKPIDLYPGTVDGTTSSIKYPSLNQWEYLKETMPIWLDFSVLAFDAPTFVFEIQNYENSGPDDWKAIKSFEGIEISTDSTLTKYGDISFNTHPNCYYVSGKELIESISEITQNHKVRFRIRIETAGKQETTYDFFDGASLDMKAHRSPQAYFTSAIFTNSNLEAEWVVKDDSGGKITNIGLNIQENSGYVSKQDYPTTTEYTWENFGGFSTDEKNYEFLHIAPILYSKLSTQTTNATGESYVDKFTTYKETTNYIYTVAYNVSPTVSYRANALGINYQNVSTLGNNDAVLALGAYSNRKKVYLIGTEQEATIDILTGALSNFIVDCGSWDDVSDSTTEEI